MKIAIIGATGMAGLALYKESTSRGHEVTAIVRHKDKAISLLGDEVKVIDKDIFELAKTDLEDFDVIVRQGFFDLFRFDNNRRNGRWQRFFSRSRILPLLLDLKHFALHLIHLSQ